MIEFVAGAIVGAMVALIVMAIFWVPITDGLREENALLRKLKGCPHCHDPHLIKYSSISKQQCSNCGALLPWNLKEGQKPLVTNNRDKRREK